MDTVMGRRKKVGIMGGTFNPVHMGHLLLAENAYSMFSLDEILFIPSGCSYMKDPRGILDGPTRLHMTALSISDNPHFPCPPWKLTEAAIPTPVRLWNSWNRKSGL